MDPNEMYEAQAGMEDSSERLEKKEQLRAKVQALVSYYEEEKRRNEELTMEVERLKAEQQSITGSIGPGGPPPAAPGMNAAHMPPMPGMNPPAAPGMPPAGAPGMPAGIPFSQRPQQQNAFQPQPPLPGAAGPDPQAPGGYTLQGFGAPQGPQGFPQAPQPPRPPQPPQNPWQQQGQQNPWQQPQQPSFGQLPQPPFGAMPQQPGFPPQAGFGPGPQQPPSFEAMPRPGFGAGPQGMPGGMSMPGGMPGFPPQAPAYPNQNAGLSESIGLVLDTITQVRSKLHQFESIRGYGYQQQPAFVDFDTVTLLDKLYDQLGDLSRELMQRQGR